MPVYLIWSTLQKRYVRALEGDGDVCLACVGEEAAKREAKAHSEIDLLGQCVPVMVGVARKE